MTPLLLLMLALGSGTPSGSEINYETVHLERRLQAVKISEKINVDGKLDEPAWKQAPVASDFTQNEPKEGEPATERTEVRVLYDNRNLYIGVYAHDSHIGRVVISDLKKDFTVNSSDSFEVVLDTFHDERNGYIFSTNAAGAKYDAQMINEGRETNSNWDGVWYVKTTVVDDGWIAEIAVPFKTFKFRENEVQTWGINFHRNLRSNLRNEDSFWAPLPRIYGLNRVSLAGTLEGLEGIQPGSNFRFKPYLTSSYADSRTAGTKKGKGDVGFDVKYGLTSGLTWDFTYNTDFSQVEADEQQINLTRFNLFFPEKREFFLENSGIFKFGGGDISGGGGGIAQGRTNGVGNDVFFFSRNIGLSPSGEAIPILGGTRLTGRAGSYEIGFLNIQQREYNGTHPTNFTVGRLKHNIMANSDVGVIVMNKEVKDSSEFNRLFGADANFRFGQYTTFNAFLVKSKSPGVESHNMAGRAAFKYQDRTWNLSSSFSDLQDNYINEMGYYPRTGVRRYNQQIRYTIRPASNLIRQIFPHLVVDYFEDQQGHIDSKYIDYHFPISFQNGAFMELGKNANVEVLREPFSLNNGQTVVPAGTYSYYDYFITFRPDPTRRVQPSGRWGIGPFYTGYKHSYAFSETLRLSNKFNTSLTYTHNNISLAGPNGHFKTNLLTTRVNYSFSTTMFLNALVQYNSVARQWSSNIRFNIIHHPLSDFFLVYNERRNSLSGDLLDRALIAKITYMFQR